MKIAVVNIKELFKCLVAIASVCIILTITTNFFMLKKSNKQIKDNNLNGKTYECFSKLGENNKEEISNVNNKDNEKNTNNKIKENLYGLAEKVANYININNLNKRTLFYLLPDIKLEENNENSVEEKKSNFINSIRDNICNDKVVGKILSTQLGILDKDINQNVIRTNSNIEFSKENNNIDNNNISNNIVNTNANIENTNAYENEKLSNTNETKNNTNGNNNENNIVNDKNILVDKKDTKIIEENNLPQVYNIDIDGIKIKNQSSIEITNDIIDVSNFKPESPKNILIFHTHTCESYTKSQEDNYEESGNYRTLDLNHSVVDVGNCLEANLKQYGYNIIHNNTYHDYPKYNGSYSRSSITVSDILSNNKDYNFVIDLHRDAIGSTPSYAPRVQIGDEKVAQVMFVLGTNGGGLYHPYWQENFKYAVAIQKKANELYPGLFRPIILRDSRYNQQLAKGAVIIEVGATGNTLKECEGSMKYLAKVISEVIK